MASNAIADLNFWKRRSTCQQKIGHIRSVRRQIGDCPACGDEFSETSLAILKMLTERPQSDRETSVGELHRAAVLFRKPAPFEQAGISQSAALQL